ncbi:beta-ketoacyl-ACP synthase II, partial [Planctomycetota bacterium]
VDHHLRNKVRFMGCCRDFDPASYFDRKEQRRLDRFCQLATAAADMALADAGIAPEEEKDRGSLGIIIASGIGGIGEIHEQTGRLHARGPRRVSPHFVPKMMINAASGNLASRYGITGLNFATTSACASSSHALAVASAFIRLGYADLIIAGGSEAATNPLGLAAFCAARALSTRNDEPERASRPFDKNRDGFVLGEGAGVVILEELSRAKARGAKVYAELAGCGMTDDAHHVTAPLPDGAGAAAAMQKALQDAALAPEDIQHIVAHGTSTPLGDVAETKAIWSVFGEHAQNLAVTATKSQIGHLLGAAGVIGIVTASLAIEHSVAPPTINYETEDPDCNIDCVPNEPRPLAVSASLTNALGFGGHNVSLALRRFTG